jgi:hypothetical protein
LVFGALLLLQGVKHGSKFRLLLAGVLFAWVVFLRPVLGGVLAFAAFLVGLRGLRLWARRRDLLYGLALFLLPFVTLDGAWALRNYRKHEALEPLAARYSPTYTPLDMALFRFLQSWGGSIVHWDPRAEIVWFEYEESPSYKVPPEAVRAVRFPSYAFTSRFGESDLRRVKQLMRDVRDESLDSSARQSAAREATRLLSEYTESVRREKPFVYFVVAPLRLLRRFVVHSGSYYLFSRPVAELGPPELGLKLLMSGLYWWTLLFGAVGFALAIRQGRHRFALWLLGGTALYVTLVHPLLLRQDEGRYLVPAYPFWLVFASYASCRFAALLCRTKP